MIEMVLRHFPGSAVVSPDDCLECLDGLSSVDLFHLAHLAQDREACERRAREQRIA